MVPNHKGHIFTRRRKINIAVILLLTLPCFILLHVRYNSLSVQQYFNNLTPISLNSFENVLCNYPSEDALPSAEDINFSPSFKSIYFHETTCTGNLTSRQWCSIESAARAHPDFRINVLFNAPLSKATLEDISLKHAFANVRLARIHIDEYVKGSAVENIVASGELSRSQWRVSHTSDVLRFLTLSKWGGIYLDMDVVVAKRLDSLGHNWAASESDAAVGTAALAFSDDEIGRRVSQDTLRDLQMNFKGDQWAQNGPGVITRVLTSLCSTSNTTLMTPDSCKGFVVHGPELFYPIRWQDGKEYFKPGELKNKDAYVYHVWNHLTGNIKVDPYSPYAQLARRFCPSTYALYGNQFGT